ncbi:DUF3131 domain-containing protein [Irregularibacter muris]|uniref:DUF3131 domain-containing protein n=2 Tax=Irregularibacter muris TaxID=1796619 RepID=A0AAE3HJ11_9FIRM|nr:DUF3131 domain-containing protein [Irregularibacter muris]
MIFLWILFILIIFMMMSIKFKKSIREKYPPIEINDVLLNSEQLEQHGIRVAENHSLSPREKSATCLRGRLRKNYREIFAIYKELNQDGRQGITLSPASEWLLDNFYVVENQVKSIEQNLTKDKCAKLAILNSGSLKGVPRIYALALELVSHTDGRIDEQLIYHFLKSYQSRQALSIAELWVLPQMITMAMIENIHYICKNMEKSQEQLRAIHKLKHQGEEAYLHSIEEHLNSMEEIHPTFAEYLVKALRKNQLSTEGLQNILERKQSQWDGDLEELAERSYQQQASRKVSMGNSITSLHRISTLEWNEIFENLSLVEDILRQDPANIYSVMDFDSRDYYRQQIEDIAKECRVSEKIVAKKVLECAAKGDKGEEFTKEAHVGYYLLDRGKKQLYSLLGKKYQGRLRKPSSFYTFPVILLTLLLGAFIAIYTYSHYLGEYPNSINALSLSFFMGLFSLIPLSDIVIHLQNWIITRNIQPRFIPKLEFKEGVPESHSTLVVIPTLLTRTKGVKDVMEQLEVHYLANREKNFYFAVAGDFKDAEKEHQEQDEDIIDQAMKAVDHLNKKYKEEKFFFFHRKRTYNEKEKRWMGWERKRGALVELNQLLRGSHDTSYTFISQGLEQLPTIQYVITLDGDTKLPIEEGRKLVGAMAHPLNHPVIHPEKGIVVEGYGLIQPRIAVDIESSNKTAFSRIFAGQGGIDPYTTAVSDVYQDLFGQGIFTGKGIYHLETFQKCLGDALPSNAILSHDLLEGSYIRAGLATDIQLIDSYPFQYSSYMMRLHRWVRGDWQLIPWLSHRIYNGKEEKINNPINRLSRWKILDNLRRSLVSTTTLLFILLSVAVFPGNILLWLILGILMVFFPVIMGLIDYLILKYHKAPREKLNGNMIHGLKSSLYQGLLRYTFLPYDAFYMMDAIIRTLYRINISKINMLEWTTAADAERNLANDFHSYMKRMKAAYFIGIAFILLTFWWTSEHLLVALVLSIPWFLSPWIAHRVSMSSQHEKEELRQEDYQTLMRLARKTWAYYQDFAQIDNNFLPPDNVQINPPKGVAPRTSPTNIGFLLMAIMTARDFGFISTAEMAEKIHQTLSTIKKLECWKGHLYNWYDTKTLKVLPPRYVSTVDSGNFISYLMTLKIGLQEYLEKNIVDMSFVKGMKQEVLLSKPSETKMIQELNHVIQGEKIDIDHWKNLLEKIENLQGQDSYWQEKLQQSVEMHKKTIQEIFPWSILTEQSLKGIDHNVNPLIEEIKKNNSLVDLEKVYKTLLEHLIKISTQVAEEHKANIEVVIEDVTSSLENVVKGIERIKDNIKELDIIIQETDFSYLYDEKRQLFSIGYNGEEQKLTDSYYDLLASEARVTSYLAVVQGRAPKKHWYRLGRALTKINGYRSLVSWTGTMFEYFMPPLIMKYYDNTLLSETYGTAIKAQVKYGKERGVPWGTSESGYYAFDLSQNYQYKAFGVPELGLKRGLKSDLVISPYSSFLALPYTPDKAMNNIYELIGGGLEGTYGLYEAVDYTPKRLSKGENKAVIESFMAHHQGMSFVVLNNVLHDNIMVKRFHHNPMVKAGESLLQEKIPLRVIMAKEYKDTLEDLEQEIKTSTASEGKRSFTISKEKLPHCHLLSNGRYQVMLTNQGTGYSKVEEIYLTRWREEALGGNYGDFIFLRNVENNELWSTTYRPLGKNPQHYQVEFSEDKAKFIQTQGGIETHTEIVVSPEDPVEIRKVNITNHQDVEVDLEITNYAEIVLAPKSADLAHPAFSNLFVRTEKMENLDGILASRRPREEKDNTKWSFHTIIGEEKDRGKISYETSRYKFIGRGKKIPQAEALIRPLENTSGAVLDPIISLRKRIKIAPEDGVELFFVKGFAENKEQAYSLGEKYGDILSLENTFEMARIRSQIELTNLNIREKDMEMYQDMIAHILFISPTRKKYSKIMENNNRGQSSLWAYGISGDLPIVLVCIKKIHEIDLVEDMVKAHQYWESKGLKVDLVILNQDESSYFQPMEEAIREKISHLYRQDKFNQSGGIFVLNAAVLPQEDQTLLYSVAKFVLQGEKGSVEKQLKEDANIRVSPKKIFRGTKVEYPRLEKSQEELFFYNGYGGFIRDGSEYVIELDKDNQTPAPWINVISNPDFGFQISENGSGFIWAENSRENKLTPWSNDPITDPPGEVIYIRDEDNGDFWTPTPLPIRGKEKYTIRHGWGYTEFHYDNHGIDHKLTMFVPLEDATKLSMLRLKNHSDQLRTLVLTYYVHPVMGVAAEDTQPFIVTSKDEETGSLFIRNTYQSEFPNGRIALASSETITSYTGSRKDFLGHQGDLSGPIAMSQEKLSNNVGAGFIPCGAIQIEVSLQPQEEKDISFLLAYGNDTHKVRELIGQYKDIHHSNQELQGVKNYWKNLLSKIQVNTPDASMNYLLNGWLLYQSIACRLWARSAFYQSGGAYGYRDQMQDTMNLLPVFPQATREQILINSAHQFKEGDVQHWWHPGPGDKGIRTRFSDDLLWLPLAVAEYLDKTQDTSILEEKVAFLEDAPLEEGQDERYGVPKISEEMGTVYEHCIRAIDHAMKFGDHGIPLMGSGDWNDGMSTVGNKGKGESVWMGWFLYLILNKFIKVAQYKEDKERAEHYQKTAEWMLDNMEKNAWDGNWYRRAYFDDGTPLGSIENKECMIDSLAQSWSVISGGGQEERRKQAMEAVEHYLVKREEGLILLFTPPFDEGDLHPGYIKGYVPGVRENGGQYTHGATWVINAMAMMGEGDKAWEYFHLINPINHSRTPIECATYKVEPYVMAADVYAISPHVGRGGWTWYTGAAGWMYTVGLKYILGLDIQGDKLLINPCIPKDWKEYDMQYRYQDTLYEIKVYNPQGVNTGIKEIKIDGNIIKEEYIELKNDQKVYKVEVKLG